MCNVHVSLGNPVRRPKHPSGFAFSHHIGNNCHNPRNRAALNFCRNGPVFFRVQLNDLFFTWNFFLPMIQDRLPYKQLLSEKQCFIAVCFVYRVSIFLARKNLMKQWNRKINLKCEKNHIILSSTKTLHRRPVLKTAHSALIIYQLQHRFPWNPVRQSVR